MTKLNLNFDEAKSLFKTEVPVLVNHLNYGNHLGYDSIFSIIQEARMRWLKKYNLSEKTIDNDVGYLISDVALTYKSEAFHGDILQISLYADNIKSRSFTLHYQITNLTMNTALAISQTNHICYDFKIKKVVTIPNALLTIMQFQNRASIE